MFSNQNIMDPGILPEQLHNMSLVEQQLIARISPCLNVHMLKHGGIASSGHCVTFPQEVNEPAKIFPRLPHEIEIIKIRKQGKNDTSKEFKVSRSKVEKALIWLKKYNPAYHDIVISKTRLECLPEDGELDAIPTAEYEHATHYNDKGPAQNQTELSDVDNCNTSSGVLFPDKSVNIKEQVKAVVEDVVGNSSTVTENRNGILSIPWPSRGDIPLSEFTTQYFFTLAFPCLFPYGTGDFHINRPRTCTSMADWADHLIWYKDGRFSRHQYFKFVVHNMIVRKQTLQKSSFIIQQKIGDAHITVDELKEKIERGDQSIASKILYFTDTLRGTSQYWARRSKELRSLEQYKINEGDGLPSFFTTGSCAEFHFKPLRQLLTRYIQETRGQTVNFENHSELFETLQQNTHIVAKYFDMRTKSYFEHVMGPVFGVDTYWYRQEFAKSRGMVHWHGLCWRKDKEPHNLLFNCVQTGLSNAECAEQLSEWAKYEFGLSAQHPAGSDDTGLPRKDLWPPPEGSAPAPPDEKNPLVKLLMDVSASQESVLEDYLLLTNRFNMHRCSDYCLKPNKFKPSLKECRMEYGPDTNPGKHLRTEPAIVKDKHGSMRLEMPRDHPMLVQNSRFHTQGWRANGDISLILSTSGPDSPSVNDIIATERYITSYACKGNQSTDSLSDLFSDIVNTTNNSDTSVKSLCTKFLMNTVKRDISATEASFELCRLPLYRCSRTFQSISVSGFRVIEKDGATITKSTALDKYLSRHKNDKRSFYQYVCKSGKVPVFSSSVQASWPLEEEYCRIQLLIHWPNWRQLSDIKSPEKSWCDTMQMFLLSDGCPNFLKAEIERNKKKHNIPVNPEDIENEYENNISSQQPDWMESIRPDQNFDPIIDDIQFNDGGEHYNWEQTSYSYPNNFGTDFIDKLTDLHDSDHSLNIPNVDLHSLNNDQLLAFNIIMQTLEQFQDKSSNYEPLRLVVAGTAGSGKSHLIKCVTKAVRLLFGHRNSVQIVCPTGNSANIIGGVTLHSFLKIPTSNIGQEMSVPQGSTGENLQSNLDGLNVLLVDERSLIGATTLGWMEFMCRYGAYKGKQFTNSWGGLPVVVFLGDDVQLPPVLDSPVYNCKSTLPAALHGVIVWQEFTKCVTLGTVVRQNNEEIMLKDVLSSLRQYTATPDQAKWLQNFQWNNLKSTYGDVLLNDMHENGLFVFPTNREVWDHNKAKLLEFNQTYPVAEIRSVSKGRHSSVSMNEKAGGLLKTLFICKNAKVMLTVNLSVRHGLFNGALGTVVDIIYLNERRPPIDFPDVVMVEFHSYSGPHFVSSKPKLVPIVPVERRIDCICHSCKRKQLPLRLGWATTIHKCQGLTIGEGELNRYIIINPGTRAFESKTPGALFVALSRARSAGNAEKYPDFAWCPYILVNEDRICHIVNTITTQARTKEIKRLTQMSIETKCQFEYLLGKLTFVRKFDSFFHNTEESS